jgi:hypothetical protein
VLSLKAHLPCWASTRGARSAPYRSLVRIWSTLQPVLLWTAAWEGDSLEAIEWERALHPLGESPAWKGDIMFYISNWMSLVDGSKKLSELSIPGTHDSAARYGGPLFVTQSHSLREQLNSGVRFLDIRCRHIEDVFAIHHDLVFEHLFFGDVKNICRAFLAEHRQETIIISVKEEYTADSNTQSFEATFDKYVREDPALWYLENRIPTLNEVRGKIVLFG